MTHLGLSALKARGSGQDVAPHDNQMFAVSAEEVLMAPGPFLTLKIFRFLVCIFEFQKPLHYTSVWRSEAQDSTELKAMIRDDHCACSPHKVILEVFPQPRASAVALVAADDWHISATHVPILIHVYSEGRPCLVEFFVGLITHGDIRFSIRQFWPTAGRVYGGQHFSPG